MNANHLTRLPTLWQTLLAVVLGVVVGMLLNALLRVPHRYSVVSARVYDAVRLVSPPSQLSVPQVPQLTDRMNILLLGVDSNGRNTNRFANTRSDTMMVVSCDPGSKKVGVVSIPRDSRVKLAHNRGVDKINAAHALGGPRLAVETVEEALGIPIDHYVVVDVQGLKKFFEMLGPIEVLVEKKMRYTDHADGLRVTLDPGLQKLTPEQAEQYVRYRHDSRGDIGRIERQQWFLRQVAQKLKEPQIILKLPDLYNLMNECVVTDLSVEDMAKLASFSKDVKPCGVETATLPGAATCIHGGSYWCPDPEADAVVLNRLLGVPISSPPACSSLSPVQPAGSLPEDSVLAANGTVLPPVTVAIKYPRGAEDMALGMEKAVNTAGFRVKCKIRCDLSDCRHEQIVENSYRSDELLIKQLKEKVPLIETWPVAIGLDARASYDVTIVIAPTSRAPLPAADERQPALEK